jgi:chemotaxis protein CheX
MAIIRNATLDVFRTMFDMELEPEEGYVDQSAPTAPTAGLLSLIGFAGAWVGTGTIGTSGSFACKAASRMLMAEYDSVNEEVLDAAAEAANMIFGCFKTELEAELGPMGLSIPTVIYGRNFIARTLGTKDWIVTPFHFEGERVEIQVCLAPAESKNRGTARVAFGVNV